MLLLLAPAGECYSSQCGSENLNLEDLSALWNFSGSQDLHIVFYFIMFQSCPSVHVPSFPLLLSLSFFAIYLLSVVTVLELLRCILSYLTFLIYLQLGDWNYLGCLPLLGLFGVSNGYTSNPSRPWNYTNYLGSTPYLTPLNSLVEASEHLSPPKKISPHNETPSPYTILTARLKMAIILSLGHLRQK